MFWFVLVANWLSNNNNNDKNNDNDNDNGNGNGNGNDNDNNNNNTTTTNNNDNNFGDLNRYYFLKFTTQNIWNVIDWKIRELVANSTYMTLHISSLDHHPTI